MPCVTPASAAIPRTLTLSKPPAENLFSAASTGTRQQVTTYLGGFSVETEMTWRDPSLWTSGDPDASRLVAEVSFKGLEDLSEPGNGWLIHEYRYKDSLDGTIVNTTMLLPGVVERAYPGYSSALEDHIRNEIQNLAGFLPDFFEDEFVVGELESRGSYTVSWKGFWQKEIVVDQEIKGLMPEMMDWWWDNINTTQRYKWWHPTAHNSFEWIESPENPDSLTYSVGAVQEVDEYLGSYRSRLLITWADPALVEDQVEYSHWLHAKTDLAALRNILPQTLIHEY